VPEWAITDEGMSSTVVDTFPLCIRYFDPEPSIANFVAQFPDAPLTSAFMFQPLKKYHMHIREEGHLCKYFRHAVST
jgi:hypothetical protein